MATAPASPVSGHSLSSRVCRSQGRHRHDCERPSRCWNMTLSTKLSTCPCELTARWSNGTTIEASALSNRPLEVRRCSCTSPRFRAMACGHASASWCRMEWTCARTASRGRPASCAPVMRVGRDGCRRRQARTGDIRWPRPAAFCCLPPLPRLPRMSTCPDRTRCRRLVISLRRWSPVQPNPQSCSAVTAARCARR